MEISSHLANIHMATALPEGKRTTNKQAAPPVKPQQPPDKTVVSINETSKPDQDRSQNNAQEYENLQKNKERSYRIDSRTKTPVYQEIDKNTGDVIFQMPSEKNLKMRAYMNQMATERAQTDKANSVSKTV